MRKLRVPFACVPILALTMTCSAAQALPTSTASQVQATALPSVVQSVGARMESEAGARKVRRGMRVGYRHRKARHHRHGWRDVWVYRAHDRHGYRHYEYVRRKFGGYFARGRTGWHGHTLR